MSEPLRGNEWLNSSTVEHSTADIGKTKSTEQQLQGQPTQPPVDQPTPTVAHLNTRGQRIEG